MGTKTSRYSLSLSDIEFPLANKKNSVVCTFCADNIHKCVMDAAYVTILNKAGLMYWSIRLLKKNISTDGRVCTQVHTCIYVSNKNYSQNFVALVPGI